ncbi:hypothetical protein MKW98_004369 [Papaver atlanticum]|uniref:Uncharacterized protein n=1 Tax=Papaver atlanticum TaxID=357466 RepID=A0AAD4SN26_9MAGN|nr:hypothetical protein MKW98_004369 [Papaver atlanticum]
MFAAEFVLLWKELPINWKEDDWESKSIENKTIGKPVSIPLFWRCCPYRILISFIVFYILSIFCFSSTETLVNALVPPNSDVLSQKVQLCNMETTPVDTP